MRLRPAPHCRTPILSYSLRVEPAEHFINWQQDPFANYLARLVFPEQTTEFRVTVDLVAEMAVYNPFDFFLEPERREVSVRLRRRAAARAGAVPGARARRRRASTQFLSPASTAREQRTIDFLVGLNQRLQHDIRYLIRMEPGVQTPEQTLATAAARAATAAGCWCSCCATSGWRRASSRAT